MIRKLSILFAGALMGATAMTVVSQNAGTANAAGSDTYRQLAIFGDVFERVRAQYVDEPDDQKLIETAINGMLTSLDPHSSYMNAKEAADMRTETRGQFGGLGIEVTMEDELVKVVSPFEGTPADKAGVMAGDLIAEIDGEQVRGLTLGEAVEKMKGDIGTSVSLTIIREGATKPVRLTVTRDEIKVPSVRHSVEGDIGYIKLLKFNEQTTIGLEAAVADIKEQVGEDKLKGYILDLRRNPGGLLDEAVSVSDAFLDNGEIVSTRGRNSDETRRYNARTGDEIDGKPLVVLVNGGSASASEIVAGALQDQRRATVVGSRSFGKGSVQTIIPLGANGALRLTTALYYTPSGRSIQGRGIDPDIGVEQPLPQEIREQMGLDPQEDISRGESSLRGHITGNEEDDQGSGSLDYVPPEKKDDLQMQYAIDLLNGVKTNAMFPPKQEANAAN
ncbi:S41 family peptidase [Aurantimonas sp. C2-6-R+9]|uniref:S41 family peptidase n=2 Tax=root TaxID=1 RepID=A0A9C9NCL5_9HYPH|nr:MULTISPECIES: S41 family peptidase [unclassified Aurantimonas]MEC5293521.1 S41 family peptidase [Aurantimonas sp. C2-3-R2]MEC5383697.1 S41 family peptidase [Aurantimonas sp. C2-6-R+9]MEC5414598.1 S41 family peptidase [Aurantimonas sp. C2-4-R8]HDZ71360.1 S41 family peptidase [Aurantimonas coralicida]HET98888.1 S41 family peptidase [Aurantimonas coralicida]